MANALRCLALSLALAVCGANASRGQPADLAAAVAAPDPDAESAVQTTTSDSQRMLAPVMIAGAGPYPFIVDTAAERSVISRQLADSLALRVSGSSRLLSMTSVQTTPLVTLPRVSFVPGHEREMRVFAIHSDSIGASGVLGIDALRDQRVVLDFDANEMRLTPAPRDAEPEPPLPNEIIVHGRRRYGELVLVDADANGTPVDVIVDTGLQVSVGNDPLRRLLTESRGNFTDITLVGITGDVVQADYTTVDRLRIGGFEIKGMPVAFAQAYFFRRLHLTRRPALLLGMDVLRSFRRVTVDFRNHRARFLLRDPASSGAQ